jgi:two-component system response regulator RegA
MTSKANTRESERAAESAATILVVDDDDVYRRRMMHALAERGFEVRGAADAEAALECATAESPEFAVVDLRMPGRSGLELVRGLREIDPATNIVVLTGYGSISTALEAIRLGATHYLTKPADVDEVLAAFGRPHRFTEGGARDLPPRARAEQEHIDRVLAHCNGNISQAAQLLGVHRRSLQRRLLRDRKRSERPPKP